MIYSRLVLSGFETTLVRKSLTFFLFTGWSFNLCVLYTSGAFSNYSLHFTRLIPLRICMVIWTLGVVYQYHPCVCDIVEIFQGISMLSREGQTMTCAV